MTPEQWQQVRDVLHSVVQLPANQRSAYLDVHCAGDPALRREVEQLLAAEGNVPTSFLESPALEQLPRQTGTSLSGTGVNRRHQAGALRGSVASWSWRRGRGV